MTLRHHILFGTAYYDEYQPSPNLDTDIRLMREAHMNVVRVGEGSWSHWEPEDGLFSLDWLEPVLDKAAENGIDAIIGVPTFSIPQWLVRKYPEIALCDEKENPIPFGSREEHSYSHPIFRFYAARLIEKIIKRYAQHPAVIGWQLHNEPGLKINYSHDAFEGFKDYLRHAYGTVEKLNKEWGLTYWSHELSTWDDLWKPEGNCQPQYDIEWRRYQATLTDEMLAWQRKIITDNQREGQFITVNIALGRDTFDEAQSADRLDIAGSDPYFHMQDGLRLPDPELPQGAWFPSGPWAVALQADRTYSVKQAPFLVMETDGGPIGGAADNYPGFHGQWRQAAWQFISRGANMIEYWQWQQLHYGTETYWGGILPHDRKPGRVYDEISALGAELNAAGETVTDLIPDFDVTMLYSVNSRWGLEYEPYHAANNMADPHRTRNGQAYDDLITAFYSGAFISGHQVRLVQDEQVIDSAKGTVVADPAVFATENPVLVVVGMYICSDEMLAWLSHYVEQGGHLILGPRSGYADRLARARLEVKPSGLSDAAKVSYQEFSNIDADIPAVGTQALPLRKGSAATTWIDCLQTDGAEILATSTHPHFSQFPLVTSEQSGRGRITVVGTVPNKELAASILDDAVPGETWVTGHETVSHSSAVNSAGERLHFLFNWSWKETSVDLPVKCAPLASPSSQQPLTRVDLGPWDVVVLKASGK